MKHLRLLFVLPALSLTHIPAWAGYGLPNDSSQAINLDQLVVTATRTKKTLANTPVVTRVITADDISRLDATNLRDVLEAELPGVEYSFSMNQQVSLKLQGMGGMSILILVDGERLAGETLDNTDFQRLTTDDIERIEIVKGAASALYGSNSVGAVINIITKSSSRPFQLQLASRLGSRNADQRHAMSLGLKQGQWTNMLNATTNKANSYTVYDTGTDRATTVYGTRQWNFKEKLIWRPNDHHTLTGKAGYYFHQRDASPQAKDRARDFSGSLRYEGQLTDRDYWEASYSLDRYDKSDFYPATRKDVLDYKNMQNSLRLIHTHTFSKRLALTSGTDAMADYLESYQFHDNASHRQVTADVFTQVDCNIGPKWNIVAGLRADYFSKYGWELTPKLSAMFHSGRFRLRGGFSRGFRAPTLKEMYMDFNMANIFNIYGNTNLKSERSNSLTASVEYTRGCYDATITGYLNMIDDEITTLWDPSLDNGRGAMHYENVEGTSLASVDVALVARYSCGLSWKLNYSYFHELTRNGAKPTSDSRPHSLTWQVDWQKKWTHYRLNIALNGRYLSSAHFYSYALGDYGNYQPASAAAYQVWKTTTRLTCYDCVSLMFGIDNIFNYKPNIYQYNSLYTQGATFYCGLAIDVDKIFKL